MKKFSRIGMRDIQVTDMNSQQLKSAKDCFCPCCGEGPLDGATGLRFKSDELESSDENNTLNPTEGDPSICCYCSEVIIYQLNNGKLTLRKPTEADLTRLQSIPDLWDGIQKIKVAVEKLAEESRLKGDRRYAGKTKKLS